jgi:hypothetical protein
VQLGLIAKTAYRSLNLVGRHTCGVSVHSGRSGPQRDVDAADAVDLAEDAMYATRTASAGHSMNVELKCLHHWLSVGFAVKRKIVLPDEEHGFVHESIWRDFKVGRRGDVFEDPPGKIEFRPMAWTIETARPGCP